MLVVVEYFRVLKGKRPIDQWDVELCAGVTRVSFYSRLQTECRQCLGGYECLGIDCV